MNAQPARSLSLPVLLLLACLPAAAAGQPVGQRGDFMRQAVQVASASPAGAAQPLFTVAGVRFNAMGADPAQSRREAAGFQVSLFHLLNALSDRHAPVAAEDYLLRLNLSF